MTFLRGKTLCVQIIVAPTVPYTTNPLLMLAQGNLPVIEYVCTLHYARPGQIQDDCIQSFLMIGVIQNEIKQPLIC